MLDLIRSSLLSQFQAALCTVDRCVTLCPERTWHALIGNMTFDQVAFHAIFYGDVYLGPDLASLKTQAFHQEHAAVFADYEELEPQKQVAVYEKGFISAYIEHCRTKAEAVIGAESEASLAKNPGFDWLKMPRAEVYIYNLKHLQHHAAQLSLRLRLDDGIEVPWIGMGWRAIESKK